MGVDIIRDTTIKATRPQIHNFIFDASFEETFSQDDTTLLEMSIFDDDDDLSNLSGRKIIDEFEQAGVRVVFTKLNWELSKGNILMLELICRRLEPVRNQFHVEVWNASTAKAGLLLGRRVQQAYLLSDSLERAVPVIMKENSPFTVFIERDPNGSISRVVFAVYHPEAHFYTIHPAKSELIDRVWNIASALGHHFHANSTYFVYRPRRYKGAVMPIVFDEVFWERFEGTVLSMLIYMRKLEKEYKEGDTLRVTISILILLLGFLVAKGVETRRAQGFPELVKAAERRQEILAKKDAEFAKSDPAKLRRLLQRRVRIDDNRSYIYFFLGFLHLLYRLISPRVDVVALTMRSA
ncbi:MAG: hypothetical protein M1834_009265 [Cirrosporium novae-zelandiae]|nr:MAG: hypothetical protein M1834_009265 [Cirrosporium novae-zelandiae]